jgi:cell division protein FtsB
LWKLTSLGKLWYTSKVNNLSQQSRSLLSNIALGLLGIYLAVSLLSTIKRNYELQREIATVEENNKQLEQSNLELTYQIAYYQTDLYKDKAARAKLGLQAPNESVLILPKSEVAAATAGVKKPKRSNIAQWIDFLRGITQ